MPGAIEAERVFDMLMKVPASNAGAILGRSYLKARLLAARGDREAAIAVLSDDFESIEPGTVPDPHNKQYREGLFLLSKYRDRMGDYDGAWRAAQMAHDDDESNSSRLLCLDSESSYAAARSSKLD